MESLCVARVQVQGGYGGGAVPDAGRDDQPTRTAGRASGGSGKPFIHHHPCLEATITTYASHSSFHGRGAFHFSTFRPPDHDATMFATQDEAKQSLGRAEAAQKKGRAALTKASKESAQLKQRLREAEKDRDRALAHAR